MIQVKKGRRKKAKPLQVLTISHLQNTELQMILHIWQPLMMIGRDGVVSGLIPLPMECGSVRLH